jgi:hypothetical protein
MKITSLLEKLLEDERLDDYSHTIQSIPYSDPKNKW